MGVPSLPHGTFDRFALWKEYEAIAMHFNDLIIRLRTQSLGAVAAFATLAAIITKGDTTPQLRWEVLSGTLFVLMMFWIAIWVLDQFYYNRLLNGAVAALVALEKDSRGKPHVEAIEFSISIDRYAHKGKVLSHFSQCAFYLIVFTVLFAGFCLSVHQLYMGGIDYAVPMGSELTLSVKTGG